jgi:hypothetical protein
MKKNPWSGDRMMGQLERRKEALSGEFSSKDIASTLCVYTTIGSAFMVSVNRRKKNKNIFYLLKPLRSMKRTEK